ncbi:hypothetical protein NL108_008935 [Boleophthalmus pectinirostris]|nr:hypothetical protein NL108_008935 [Boleophthalmus pectinirostris]
MSDDNHPLLNDFKFKATPKIIPPIYAGVTQASLPSRLGWHGLDSHTKTKRARVCVCVCVRARDSARQGCARAREWDPRSRRSTRRRSVDFAFLLRVFGVCQEETSTGRPSAPPPANHTAKPLSI